MKCVKAKGVPVVVYGPTLGAPEFFGSEVTTALSPSRPAAMRSSPTAGATSSQMFQKWFIQGTYLNAISRKEIIEKNIHFKNDGRLKLLIVVGTRPEVIRLSEVIKKCRRHFDCLLAHTG